MAIGTEVPPIPSGVDLTKAPFKQCGAMQTHHYYGAQPKYFEKCYPGTHGRFMYIYHKGQGSTRLSLCDVLIAAESRYHASVRNHYPNPRWNIVVQWFPFNHLTVTLRGCIGFAPKSRMTTRPLFPEVSHTVYFGLWWLTTRGDKGLISLTELSNIII